MDQRPQPAVLARRRMDSSQSPTARHWKRYHLGAMSDKKPIIVVKFVVDGVEVASLPLPPKVFKTGSSGYYANLKLVLGDDAEKGYQAQVQLIKIGSKEAKPADDSAA
jgi:hypothetical protein